MSHRYYFYVTQKSRKSQKDICHTETTEITERYIYVPIDFMSHRNHGNHRKIYVTQKPWKSQKDIFLRDFKASRFLCEKNFSVISVISV